MITDEDYKPLPLSETEILVELTESLARIAAALESIVDEIVEAKGGD